MSTKIYDAYEYDGNVEEAFKFLQKMKVRVHKQVTHTFSTYRFHTQMPQYKMIEEMQKAIQSHLNDPLNVSCSAVIYMYKDRVFIQFFGLDRTWDRRLAKVRKLKDYHYQNSTDSPDNLTDSQWDQRRKVWEGIFNKSNYTPSQAGLTFDFISESYSSLVGVVRPLYLSLLPETEKNKYA